MKVTLNFFLSTLKSIILTYINRVYNWHGFVYLCAGLLGCFEFCIVFYYFFNIYSLFLVLKLIFAVDPFLKICYCFFFVIFLAPFVRTRVYLAISSFLSVFCFFWIIFLIAFFLSPFSVAGFQFFQKSNIEFFNYFIKLDFIFAVDGISIYFVLLTVFIMPICFFLEYRNKAYENQKFFIVSLNFIQVSLIVAFTTLDLLIFFMAFESILIPMSLMIGVFGTNKRRTKASYLFFMYSFLSALFSFFLILYIYSIAGSFDILTLLDFSFNSSQQIFAWFLLFITFSAKIPMFPFHMWLPEAHVEAPTVGSMILASLLLKLGGYGFIRFSLPLFPYGTFFFLPLVKTLALLSVVYASFAAIYQLDLKKIIAYSSIAHMNIAVLGIFSLHLSGLQGAIFTMISHGLISAALFLMIGIIYDRFSTRSIVYLGGLSFILPEFSSFFFFFMICNIAFPGTSAFIGEFLTLVGIFSNNFFIFFFTIIGSFLCVVYSIRTFSFVCFGNLSARNYYCYESVTDLTREESYCLRLFLFLVFFLGVKPRLFLVFSYFPLKIVLLNYI